MNLSPEDAARLALILPPTLARAIDAGSCWGADGLVAPPPVVLGGGPREPGPHGEMRCLQERGAR